MHHQSMRWCEEGEWEVKERRSEGREVREGEEE